MCTDSASRCICITLAVFRKVKQCRHSSSFQLKPLYPHKIAVHKFSPWPKITVFEVPTANSGTIKLGGSGQFHFLQPLSGQMWILCRVWESMIRYTVIFPMIIFTARCHTVCGRLTRPLPCWRCEELHSCNVNTSVNLDRGKTDFLPGTSHPSYLGPMAACMTYHLLLKQMLLGCSRLTQWRGIPLQ